MHRMHPLNDLTRSEWRRPCQRLLALVVTRLVTGSNQAVRPGPPRGSETDLEQLQVVTRVSFDDAVRTRFVNLGDQLTVSTALDLSQSEQQELAFTLIRHARS